MVLDKTQSVKLNQLKRQGLPEENIVILTKNGIENYYPKALLCKIFNCESSIFDPEIQFRNDAVEINGVAKDKGELSNLIVPEITRDSEFDPELTALLAKIRRAID